VIGYLNTGKLPSGRAWKRAQEEVSQLRLALIEQFGGQAIKPAVLALVESAIEGLMIQRLSSLYVKKAGILRRDSLKDGNLELHSILSGQFISYANLVRLNLESAARLAGQKDPAPAMTITELIAQVDAEKDEARNQAQEGEIARPGANGEATEANAGKPLEEEQEHESN
jgi:hypothetical protein